MEQLAKAGLVMRHRTWNTHTPEPSKRYTIRLIDNFSRFYIKAIAPQIAQITAGRPRVPSPIHASGHSLLGPQLHNLVLKNRLLLPAMKVESDRIVREGPHVQEPARKRKGCQIDYLVQTAVLALCSGDPLSPECD